VRVHRLIKSVTKLVILLEKKSYVRMGLFQVYTVIGKVCFLFERMKPDDIFFLI